MKFKLMLAAQIIATWGMVSPAAAEVVTITYSGIITSVTTKGKITKRADAYVGGSYSATFVFDIGNSGFIKNDYTSQSSNDHATVSTPFGDQLIGGTNSKERFFDEILVVSSTKPLPEKTPKKQQNAPQTELAAEADSSNSLGNQQTSADVIIPIGTGKVWVPEAEIGVWTGLTGSASFDSSNSRGSLDLTADITSVMISVPEPSTWALMLLGFGGLGFASYRGKLASPAGARLA